MRAEDETEVNATVEIKQTNKDTEWSGHGVKVRCHQQEAGPRWKDIFVAPPAGLVRQKHERHKKVAARKGCMPGYVCMYVCNLRLLLNKAAERGLKAKEKGNENLSE